MRRIDVFAVACVLVSFSAHATQEVPAHSWDWYVRGADAIVEVEVSSVSHLIATPILALAGKKGRVVEQIVQRTQPPDSQRLVEGAQFLFISSDEFDSPSRRFICAFEWHEVHRAWMAMRGSCANADAGRDVLIAEIERAGRELLQAETTPTVREIMSEQHLPGPVRPVSLPEVSNPPGPVPAERVLQQ